MKVFVPWAIAIYSSSDDVHDFHGFIGNTLQQSVNFLPIDYKDSFDAETTALIWAMIWVRRHRSYFEHSSDMNFCFDSMSAIYTCRNGPLNLRVE